MASSDRGEHRGDRGERHGSGVPRLPAVPRSHDQKPVAAGMRATSVNPKLLQTVDVTPIERLRDELRASRDLKRVTDPGATPPLTIHTGTGDFLTFEELVSAMDQRPVSPQVTETLRFCRNQGVIPILTGEDGRIMIGLQATESTGGDLKSVVGLSHYLNETFFVRVRSMMRMDPRNFDILLLTGEEMGRIEELTASPEKRQKALHQINPEASAMKIFHSALHHAIQERASDIHIEPFKDKYRIRFRIDGEMKTRFNIPHETGLPLVAIIMNKAKMQLDNKRVPQDGTIRFTPEDIAVEEILEGWTMRASVTPTVQGISSVLRLLKAAKEDDFNIDKIGIKPKIRARLDEVIAAPQGLILVTGPTGSGKTTTLYACLRRLNNDNVKILTAEDPVEVTLTGTTQVEVNKNMDPPLGFPEILRSFLRQDPDIILVGEVRDQETAQTAIQASLTGHLVFSTVHTNDSYGVIPRLEALGVDPERIQSTLSAVITQRLVRKLCEACKERYDARNQINELFGEEIVDRPLELCRAKDHSRTPVGCKCCASTGYFGRKPVLELWVPGPKERQLILKGSSEPHLLAQGAEEAGMEPMLQSALELVLDQETSMKEVLDRVASLHELRTRKDLAHKVFGKRTVH